MSVESRREVRIPNTGVGAGLTLEDVISGLSTARSNAGQMGRTAGLLNTAPRMVYLNMGKNIPPESRIIAARPGERGTEVGAGMPLPAPDETSPARVTNNAIRIGNDAGESKLLERMARSGLLSTLQGMARAERMYGVGPLAAFSESALDVQAARSAAEQKQREMGLELAKERLKAGDGGADYRKALGSAQVQNLLQSAGSTFGAVNTIAEINKFLGANQASGAIESAKTLATQLGNLFGLNLDPSNPQTVSDMADTIKASLAESRLFGRDLSRTDYQLLAQLIQKPGLLTSNERIMKQYQRIFDKMSAAHSRKVRSLVDIFGGGAIGQQRAQRLLSTQPVVTENLFTEVKQ